MNNSIQPAFPHQRTDGTTNINWKYHGLTKREHFAAMAMQGLLANETCSGDENSVSKCAVIMADALLKELEQS